jgi:hypothetical protein
MDLFSSTEGLIIVAFSDSELAARSVTTASQPNSGQNPYEATSICLELDGGELPEAPALNGVGGDQQLLRVRLR